MCMILPYHDIASAAALAEASVCAARPEVQSPGEDRPVFLSPCGQISPVYKPSRWSRLVGALLAPISGQKISQIRSGVSNI